jgi:hypothetical protein
VGGEGGGDVDCGGAGAEDAPEGLGCAEGVGVRVFDRPEGGFVGGGVGFGGGGGYFEGG